MTSVDDRSWAGQVTDTQVTDPQPGRAPGAASQALGLRLDDVFLLSATPKGMAAVGGLSLLVDAGGVTVIAPSTAPTRTLVWSQTASLSFRQSAELPDGRRGTVLELVVGPRTVRFLVPADRVDPDRAPAFESHLLALASPSGVEARPPSHRTPTAAAPPLPAAAPPSGPPVEAQSPPPPPPPPAPSVSDQPPAPPALVPPPPVPKPAVARGAKHATKRVAQHAASTEASLPAPVVAQAPPPPPVSAPAAPPAPAPAAKAHVAPKAKATPKAKAASKTPPAPPAPPVNVMPAPPVTPAPEATAPLEPALIGPYAAARPKEVESTLPPPVPAYPTLRTAAGKPGIPTERPRKVNDSMAVSAGPARRRRRRALGVFLVVLVLCGLGAGAWYAVSRFATPVVDNSANLRAMASGINLQLADVPENWQLDTSAGAVHTGPVSGQGGTQVAAAVAQFARCTRASASGAAQVGLGTPPTGGVGESSATFNGAGTDVSSEVSIFPSSAAVASDLKVATLAQFPACEQQMLMDLVRSASPPGVTVAPGGMATASALPAVGGVSGTVLEVPIAVIRPSGTQVTYLEYAFVASGRVAVSVYGDGVGAPLPASLFDSFVRIVAGRTAVVATQIASGAPTSVVVNGE